MPFEESLAVKKDLVSILEAAALAAATLAFPACDSGRGDDTMAAGTDAGCPGATAGCPGTSAGCPGTSAGCPGTSAGCPGTSAGCPSAERPAEVEEVLAAIEDGSYESWEAEPMRHPPGNGSPHPGEVRTFFNPTLAQSMGAGNTEHPIGSAALKESWQDDTLSGWFIEVKVAEGTGVETWYWWSDLANVDALGGDSSVAACTGCHAGGIDYVTTAYPFE